MHNQQQLNTTLIAGIEIKASITRRVKMLVMKMVMVSVKFMSIPWKAFGRFCGLGYDLIVVFLKKSYLCIWVSLSLFIMYEPEVRLCFIRF